MTTTTQRLVDYYQWVIENGGKYLHRQTAHLAPCKDKLTISSTSYLGSCPTPRSAARVGVDPGNEVGHAFIFIRPSQITFYSQTPLNTGTSLLQTVCFVPRERKPLHFLYPTRAQHGHFLRPPQCSYSRGLTLVPSNPSCN